jgi:hypothetical protein
MSSKEEEEDSNKLEDVDAVPNMVDDDDDKDEKLERNGSIVQRFKRSVSKRFSGRASLHKKPKEPTDNEKAAEIARVEAAEAADDAARKKKEKEDDDALPKVNLTRLFYENRTEWPFIIVGVIASIFMGAIMPIFAILFGNILGVISYDDEQKARDESGFYAVMFFLLGLGSCTAQFLQGFMFAVSGEILTVRMRRKAFSAMLKQASDIKEGLKCRLCLKFFFASYFFFCY